MGPYRLAVMVLHFWGARQEAQERNEIARQEREQHLKELNKAKRGLMLAVSVPFLLCLAHPERFELPTKWFEAPKKKAKQLVLFILIVRPLRDFAL